MVILSLTDSHAVVMQSVVTSFSTHSHTLSFQHLQQADGAHVLLVLDGSRLRGGVRVGEGTVNYLYFGFCKGVI